MVLTALFCLFTAMLAYMIKRSDNGITRQSMSNAMMLVFFWIGAIHLLVLANRIFSEEVQGAHAVEPGACCLILYIALLMRRSPEVWQA